ncbi:hypothetical protein [Hyphomonas sp.]|uniref:hypothetical protein n=1 Tax=Hyphomonas sp. TaxID=87 RepID=UPI003566E022
MILVPAGGLSTTVPGLAQRVRTYLQQIAEAFEYLMEEDAGDGQPFIAALVISKARAGLSAPGFFDVAHRLGRFVGNPSGPEASAFHGAAFATTAAFWAAAAAETAERDIA